MTEAQLQERTVAERAYRAETFQASNSALVERVWKECQSADTASQPMIQVLAMSGGCDYVPFGADPASWTL